MAKQLQIRGGTTVQHSTFTGALREITIDTDKDVVVVHDGTTVGGFPLAKQTSVDSKVTKVTSTDNAIVRFNGTTGDVQNSVVIIDDNNNVGIGATPSAWTSNTAIQMQQGTSFSGYGNSTMVMKNAYYDGAFKYVGTGYAQQYEQNLFSGAHNWRTAPSGTAGNAIAFTNAMTLDASGNLLLQSGTGGLGYGTGAGGTVTQLTSKGTAVTLNKPTGTIIMNNSALAANTQIGFIVNNSIFKIGDGVFLNITGGTFDYGIYSLIPSMSVNGSFYIYIKNTTGSSLSDSVQIKFTIVKGANS